MQTAAAAIEYLRAQSITPDEAIDSLNSIHACVNMAWLFKKYFPKEFAARRISWLERPTIFDACSEFMDLVAKHLFPCHNTTDNWQDEEEEYVFGGINFFAPFPDWYEEEGRNLTDLEAMILLSIGKIIMVNGEYENANENDVQIDMGALALLCENTHEPLCHLPEAVKFTFKETGNTWVDASQEMLNECWDWPAWSVKNIEWLRKDWIEAEGICARFRKLNEWIGKKKNRAKAEYLLAGAILPRDQGPKFRTVSSAEFAAGINLRSPLL
jgi:hypothetical protein